MRRKALRIYTAHGWVNVEELKRGRVWVRVRYLYQTRKPDGTFTYRVRRVRVKDTATALWEIK